MHVHSRTEDACLDRDSVLCSSTGKLGEPIESMVVMDKTGKTLLDAVCLVAAKHANSMDAISCGNTTGLLHA